MTNNNIKRIAIFTSGGDAPGMNAAIRAVARTAIYHDLHVYGIANGYDGMIRGDISRLELRDVGNIMQRGGTILKTARSKEFMTVEGRLKAIESLKAHDIDACVAIGGNGTFTGASVFNKEHDIPFVGLPGTIDNDLFGTDYTIGFDTAINTAMEAVDKIRDTADSHNRLFFIEGMGRHSGYIALHTAIGTGASNVFLPEMANSVEDLISELRISAKRHKLFNLVIVAEGNLSGNADELAKIVKEKAPEFDTKVSVIGHLQRGGSPTCADRVLASRLGHAAVEALIHGKKNVAIGIVNDHITYTKFEDAITKTKALNKELIDMAHILAI
ncbi:MAG TPA: 6-phosphofructokinase [Saprospiraceae bacterium]|nr:6-phosphofructokinase [Saprospiraceae bacterium]